MIKSLTTAATGMAAQQTNMDVVANNIANSSTTGFKRARAEFEDLMYDNKLAPGAATGLNSISPTGVQVGMGTRTSAVQKDFTPGSVSVTRNPLDIQIEGRGFFQVRTPDGEIAYTRDGSFKKDGNGRVHDSNGNPLVPDLVIPPNSQALEISAQGEVHALIGDTPTAIGNIDIASFINPAGLKAVGKNLFIQTPSSGQAAVSKPGLAGMGYLAQGQLETSNVNIVDEMVNMITAQRAYETNSKVIQASDQMLQTAIQVR